MESTSPDNDYSDARIEHHSGVRLDSELPPENRWRRLALALVFNLLALIALVWVAYAAIERRW